MPKLLRRQIPKALFAALVLAAALFTLLPFLFMLSSSFKG